MVNQALETVQAIVDNVNQEEISRWRTAGFLAVGSKIASVPPQYEFAFSKLQLLKAELIGTAPLTIEGQDFSIEKEFKLDEEKIEPHELTFCASPREKEGKGFSVKALFTPYTEKEFVGYYGKLAVWINRWAFPIEVKKILGLADYSQPIASGLLVQPTHFRIKTYEWKCPKPLPIESYHANSIIEDYGNRVRLDLRTALALKAYEKAHGKFESSAYHYE
jgi:hypothetical protein